MAKPVISKEVRLLAFRDFRREDGLLDYHALVSAIMCEVERNEFVLLAYLQGMLRTCDNLPDSADNLSTNELLDLIRQLNNGMADDFTTFAMYQKLRPGMTVSDWQRFLVLHEPPLCSMNRAHNLFLYVLENVLGLPKGVLCDLKRL